MMSRPSDRDERHTETHKEAEKKKQLADNRQVLWLKGASSLCHWIHTRGTSGISEEYLYSCVWKACVPLVFCVAEFVQMFGSHLSHVWTLFWYICNGFKFLHLRQPAMIELAELSKTKPSNKNNETAVIAVRKAYFMLAVWTGLIR